ncbi:MAG: hypothetical protein Q4C48_04780 [Lachnospiraceae bacterium]|nr:hypothetical protein [Lachnospiraceae bacterium]
MAVGDAAARRAGEIMMDLGRLYAMTRYAYTHVPLYMRIAQAREICVDSLSDEQLWQQVPMIERQAFVTSGAACLSRDYISDYLGGRLIHERTSGSTGHYMDVFWHPQDMSYSLIGLWMRRKKYYGINTTDKYCYFFTLHVENGETLEREIRSNGLGFCKALLHPHKIGALVNELYEFSPKWLLLQPSVAHLLCKEIKKRRLPKPDFLRYVELTGEMAEEQLIHEIKNIMGCQVGNQYGCNEGNSIAFSCPEGNMHIASENVVVTLSEKQEVYLTSLTNRAMPFVKYGIGDYAVLEDARDCPCGCKSPVLRLKKGRTEDYIKLTNGEAIHAGCVHKAMTLCNQILDESIIQYQVEQREKASFLVHLVVEEESAECEDIVRKVMEQELYECLQIPVSVRVVFHEGMLPDEISGKLKTFVCGLRL